MEERPGDRSGKGHLMSSLVSNYLIGLRLGKPEIQPF